MLANFNPNTIFDAVLVCGIGLVVLRISYIVSVLIRSVNEDKTKK